MIEPTYTLVKDYLIITAEGERSNFHDVALENTEMVKEIDKYKPSKILLDHRKVVYSVNQSDALNLVRLYEKQHDKFDGIQLACCVNEKFLPLSEYWSEIAQKRGFNFKVFDDIDEAKSWLLDDKI